MGDNLDGVNQEFLSNRWAVFTPVSFIGSENEFFIRDTGLLCRALQAKGATARVVMPLPAYPEDAADIVRVPHEQLETPGFWRGLGVDAVISYSWGDPRYTKSVEAIKMAGLKLFVNMDTDGLISPFVEFKNYLLLNWAVCRMRYGLMIGAMRFVLHTGWQVLGLHRHFMRLRHLAAADVVGVVSLIAAERVRKYVRRFGCRELTKKIQYVPHPVDPNMCYDGSSKQSQVLAVGRWDDVVQKRPGLLAAVAVRVLEASQNACFLIVGSGSEGLAAQIIAQAPEYENRVRQQEWVPHSDLCEQMNRSQVLLCTSLYESFHIISAEALLCGCTLVAPDLPSLPSFVDFIAKGSYGHIAKGDSEGLASAVLSELQKWSTEGRSIAENTGKGNEYVVENVLMRIERLLFSSGAV